MPEARSLAQIKADPDAAGDVSAHMVALVPFEARMLSAAEKLRVRASPRGQHLSWARQIEQPVGHGRPSERADEADDDGTPG